jgi:hypothetical protein
MEHENANLIDTHQNVIEMKTMMMKDGWMDG